MLFESLDLGLSSIFNDLDLIWKKPTMNPCECFEPASFFMSKALLECPKTKFMREHDRNEYILDKQVLSNRSQSHLYQVRWRGRPKLEELLILRVELSLVEPKLQLTDFNMIESIKPELTYTRQGRVLSILEELVQTPKHIDIIIQSRNIYINGDPSFKQWKTTNQGSVDVGSY